MKQCEIKELYDLTQTIAGEYLARFTYPWDALDVIKDFIKALGSALDLDIYEIRG